MRRRVLAGILAALALSAGAVTFFVIRNAFAPQDFSPNPAFFDELAQLTIDGVDLNVALADTQSERTMGLSGTVALPQGIGMLFVFENEDLHGFWMDDMLFPIDILWISKNLEVIHIEKGAEPASYPHVFRPTKPALYVLELPSGFSAQHDIKIGSKIVFPREIRLSTVE